MRLFDNHFSKCVSRTQTSVSKISILAQVLRQQTVTDIEQLNALKKTREELRDELKKALEELDELGDIYSIYEVEMGGVDIDFFGKEK